jgi:hypothetical protein
MSYLDVISLQRAKDYLRVDVGFNDDDVQIESMIKASLRFIEKRTNHIMFEQDKNYTGVCQVKVYDFPINSIVTTPTPFNVNYSLFKIFPNDKEVTLNVGYAVGEVPEDLVEVALQMIKVWYYESEKQVNTTLIPMSVHEVLDIYKRFM